MAKIKPKLSKKPKSQKSDWEILPIADDGKSIYQWSNSSPQSSTYKVTGSANNVSKTAEGRTKPITEAEKVEFHKRESVRKQKEKEAEYEERLRRMQESEIARSQAFSPEQLKTETQSTGDKLSLAMQTPFGNPSNYPVLSEYMNTLDYVNPLKMIGDMASGLGSIPYDVSQGNYGQAALNIGIPLATGALAGIGAKGTKEFVNNLANPFAGMNFRKGANNTDEIMSLSAPKGNMYGENQVLVQQSRLLNPETKAKFFKHQAPKIDVQSDKFQKTPKDYDNRITPENYENFVNDIHKSTDYDFANTTGKQPHNLGIGNYGKPGMVYKDAPLNNLGKDVINAHEKNHGIFAGTLSREMETDLLKPFGTNKPVPHYAAKHQADEVLARMAQFKNAVGIGDNQVFTLGHLNLIRKNYANQFLDNGITEMLKKIPPGSAGEKKFLKNMNKYAFGATPAAIIGAAAMQEKKNGGSVSDWEIIDLPQAQLGKIQNPYKSGVSFSNSNQQIIKDLKSKAEAKERKPIVENKQAFVQAEPQGKASKTWEIVTHPMTAISNLSKYGRIPDRFSLGSTNPLDYAIDVINPAFYINAAGRTLENIITPETYTDIPKAVGSALVNLAGEEPPAEWDEAGLKTLGKAGEAIAGLSAFGLGFNQLAKRSPFVREQIYKAIEPVGYGAKEKIMKSPKAWIRNTFFVSPEERAVRIGSEFLPPSSNSAEKIIKVGKNRLDSFRLGLNLPQNFDTFEKIGEDLYRIKNMNPEVGEFSSIYNDLLANEIKNNINYGDDALKNLTKRHDKLTSPVIKTDFGDYSLNDLRRYLKKEGDDFAPWEQHRIVEKAKNKDFTHSVYDADRQGIMGSFRWDIDKPNYGGDIHFQSNDTWNLNPWEKRGPISIKDNSSFLHKYYFKPLQNVEALSLLGGKPFNIRNNFIVDPKTFKIKESFKQGGSISNWEIIPEAQSGRVIEDNMGQWKYPGEITKINSPNITMQGVNYPVLGVSDTNDVQMMYPNQDYKFKGSSVTEYPMMQPGGRTTRPPLEISDPREYARRAQAYQDSLDLYTTNRDRLAQLERESRYATNMFGIMGLYNNGLLSEHYTYLPPDQVTHNQYPFTNVPSNYENGNDRTYWGFENRRSDVSINPITYHGFDRRFRQNVIRGTNQTFNLPGQNDLHEYAGIWQFPQPVQPIIYKPEKNQESQKPKSETRNVLTPEFETVRRKKDKIELLEPKTAQLQSSPINQELNLIPFAKGTYYRRPRQSQEIGQNIGQFPGRVTGLTDLYQKGSGIRMGTIDNEGHIVDIVEGFAEGGELPEAGSGYKVIRSSERKGKTHKVIGPDGTVKFFGDSKLGQHPKDPARKKAFYARHKKNLAKNPYFRAFARKTWEEGGMLPDLMEMAAGGQFLTVGGEYHRIYKNADGDIMVNHPKEDKGKWDTINLTDKAGAKTVADGVAATKKWHKENPYAFGGRLPKAQIGLLSKLKENLGNLDTGEGYKTSLDKVLKTAIGLEGKDYSKDRMSPIAREQDALRLYLGTPTKTGAFEKTGENTYRIKDYNRLYPDTLLSDEDVSYWGTPDEEGIKYPADEAFNLYPYSDFVMGRHYITKGKDDKGKYLQYRDFWNLDPTRHANEWIDKNVNPKLAKYLKKATPVLDKLESAVFNPFELTDKVYYDPVTKLRSDIKTRNENPKYANVPTPNNFAFGGLPKADNGKNIKDKKALSEVQQKINEGYAAKKKYQEDIIKYAKSVENDPDFKKKVKDFLQEKCGGGLACISSASKLLEGAGYPLGKGYFSNPTLQEDILSKKLPGYAFDNNLKNIEVGDIMQVTGKSLKTGKERAPHHAMVITKADKDIAGNLPNLQYFGSQGDIASIGFHPLHANNYNDPSEFQIIKKQFVDPSLIQKRDSLQKVLREEDPSYGKPSNWKPRYLDYKPNERFAYDEKNYDINNPFVSLTKSRIESMYEPLLKNKEELMKKYNLTNTEFNELTKRLGGIGEQESENAGFTSGRYNIKRLPIVGPLSQFLGKISQGEFSNAFDSGEYSVGPWQTKRNYVPKNNYKRGSVEEAFETLADRYKNQVPSKYRGTDYGYGLAVNKYKGLQNPQNEYLKKVLEYSKKFDVDRDKNAGYEEYKESKKQLNPVISERKAFRDELVPTPNNFAFGGNVILEKYQKGGNTWEIVPDTEWEII